MIKARLHDNKGHFALLGLSGENMTRLMAAEPIMINLAELGLPAQRIALVGGRTEAHIIQRLEQIISPLPFTCPRCHKTSNHPDNKRYGYCAHCHTHTGEPAS